jgi:hypothetical protein
VSNEFETVWKEAVSDLRNYASSCPEALRKLREDLSGDLASGIRRMLPDRQ